MPLGSVLRQLYYISEQAIENRLHNGFNIARSLNDQIFKILLFSTASLYEPTEKTLHRDG